ncbi:MAG: alpha/beta hydrolase family protein [Bacteroidales bacterium]
MKRLSATLILLTLITSLLAQKKPLDHSVYDEWKILSDTRISDDGRWVTWEVNPQKGDGWLYIFDTETGKTDSVSRGYNARFSGDSQLLAFKIKPGEDTLRAAKKAKMKDDEMPKDSLGIWVLEKNDLRKVARVKSFLLPEEGSGWLAYHLEKPLPVKDTADKVDSTAKPKKKKKKGDGTELVIRKVIEGTEFSFEDVTEYTASKNGNLFGFITQRKDSIDSTAVFRFDPKKEMVMSIFERDGIAKQINADEQGAQLAFVFSSDTSKVKNYNLGYWQKKQSEARIVIHSRSGGLPENWRVSEHRKPDFSENGEKLFFGTAPQKEPLPEDTLLAEEKVHVDVWHWRDPLIQPQQKKQLKHEEKRNYLAVFYPDQEKMVQLGTEEIPDVRTFDKGNANMALGYTYLPYSLLITWDDTYRDYYAIDMETGEKTKLLDKQQSYVSLSPGGNYILWYQTNDSTWYVKKLLSGQKTSLTANLPFNFYYELNDIPQLPGSYGLAGWTEDDEYVLIYDKYDIWRFDPEGKKTPERITGGYGRGQKIIFRYEKLNREAEYVEKEMMLSAFDEVSKASGFYTADPYDEKAPEKIIMKDYRYYGVQKAEDAKKLIWQKSAFDLYPDLYWSNPDFEAATRITHLDAQREPYLWGDVRQVSWTSADGEKLDGLLYTPENLDESKKYPLLVYFYERDSDNLHQFYNISPSRSIINPAYCVSNGYVVFVPDIPYLVGYPGESAYRSIVSGTLAMADQFPFIDRENMGIQGQSWGGYQVAYLVTQTNLYKAAMAGAPVSNMTSAYGGVRWGSGMSRMFQYEKTQSRLGGTLWDRPMLYIENSPLFYASKIETPLLIMHNDGDGAVPWYQGIEMFMAMRRLDKPAWMLTYNDERHNLTKWPNRVDLSTRMYQFFDHYLKGAPEPKWMKLGVPAIEKGKKLGYELEEK